MYVQIDSNKQYSSHNIVLARTQLLPGTGRQEYSYKLRQSCIAYTNL